MFRTRRPGVQEGNAMDEIMAYETKLSRGAATAEDKLRYEAACRLLGIRGPVISTARQTSSADIDVKDSAPTISYMINSASLDEDCWGAIKVIGVVFLLFALSCVLTVLLVGAANSFISLAHP